MARTRSETAHRKVIDAALELVADRGVEGASMDAIAAKSGVSKATIYKHWEDKDALLLEMIAVLNGLRSRPTFDSGDTRADMVAVLAYHPEENADMRERILPHFVAYSAANKKFGNAWRNKVMEPPRRELTHLIQQGVAKGELAAGLENDLCLALLLGPILYWHMFLRINKADPQALAQGVVDVFWKAFSLKRSRTPQR